MSCISSSSAILSLSANLSLRKKMYTAPKQLFYTASWKQKMYTASRQGFSIQHLSSHQVLSGCHRRHICCGFLHIHDLWHIDSTWVICCFFSFEIGHYQWLFIAASMSEFITFIPGPWVTAGDVHETRIQSYFLGHERSLSHLYETRIQSYVGRSRILYEMWSHDSQWLTALILKTGCGEPLQKHFSTFLFQVFESKFDCVPMELLTVDPEVDMSHQLYSSHRHPE